jgi:hypothetical protein
MYRCSLCKSLVSSGSCLKRVTSKRKKYYPVRNYAKKTIIIEKGKKKKKWLDDPGGVGWEIVREDQCCVTCAAKIDSKITNDKNCSYW